MKITGYLAAMILLTLGTLSGCLPGSGNDATATPSAAIGIANPASTYCLDQGNKLEIRTAQDGGQYGVCIFPNGSECEEWAYYRGECSPSTSAPAPGNCTDDHQNDPHDNEHQRCDH